MFGKIDSKVTKIILRYFSKAFIIMMQTINTKIVSSAETLNDIESAFIMSIYTLGSCLHFLKLNGSMKIDGTGTPSFVSLCVSACIK